MNTLGLRPLVEAVAPCGSALSPALGSTHGSLWSTRGSSSSTCWLSVTVNWSCLDTELSKADTERGCDEDQDYKLPEQRTKSKNLTLFYTCSVTIFQTCGDAASHGSCHRLFFNSSTVCLTKPRDPGEREETWMENRWRQACIRVKVNKKPEADVEPDTWGKNISLKDDTTTVFFCCMQQTRVTPSTETSGMIQPIKSLATLEYGHRLVEGSRSQAWHGTVTL